MGCKLFLLQRPRSVGEGPHAQRVTMKSTVTWSAHKFDVFRAKTNSYASLLSETDTLHACIIPGYDIPRTDNDRGRSGYAAVMEGANLPHRDTLSPHPPHSLFFHRCRSVPSNSQQRACSRDGPNDHPRRTPARVPIFSLCKPYCPGVEHRPQRPHRVPPRVRCRQRGQRQTERFSFASTPHAARSFIRRCWLDVTLH